MDTKFIPKTYEEGMTELRKKIESFGPIFGVIPAHGNPVPQQQHIDPQLWEAATRVFGDEAIAIRWLSKPLTALGNKCPLDVPVSDVHPILSRWERGFVS